MRMHVEATIKSWDSFLSQLGKPYRMERKADHIECEFPFNFEDKEAYIIVPVPFEEFDKWEKIWSVKE